MTVALCSIFRNSEHYIKRYADQVNALIAKRPDVQLFLAEGDSVDLTKELLSQYLPHAHLIHVDHGGPSFGSVDNEQRWEQIASVVRPVLKAATEADPEVVVWVESDLVWDTDAMIRLIEQAEQGLAIAPMVYAAGEDRFYDIWGFRMDGKKFLPTPPYTPDDGKNMGLSIQHIDSCGSCFATPDVTSVRFWNGHWPFPGRNGLWLDTQNSVEHP